MSNERSSDKEGARKRGVLASLPGFLLKEAWRNDDLPALPEPDPASPPQHRSFARWLVEPERLPEPLPPKAMPRQTSFLRWLVSREELPEPPGEPLSRAVGERGPGFFGWLVAQEPLPQREPTPRAARKTRIGRELATVVTPVLVLGTIVALTFVADEPIRQGRVGLGVLYVAAMLIASFAGAVVTARWLYVPAIGQKLALFYIGFGFLWLNLHLLLIHTNSSGRGIWPLLTHLAIGNAIAAVATVVLRRLTRPRS